METQVVVSMLDALGIGLYQDDGTEIRRGLEQSDDDYYAFESEARGLIQMAAEHADPELQVTWPEYHEALTALGMEASLEDVVEAYGSAYQEHPDEAITKLVLATTSMSGDGVISPLGLWLLWLDGMVPGALSDGATGRGMAFAGGPVVAQGPATGLQQAGAAFQRLQQLFQNQVQPVLQQNMSTLRMMTLVRTTTVLVEADASTVHEGHDDVGPPVTFTAIVRPCGGVSPFSGNCSMPANPVLSGVNVTWQYSPALTEHGSVSAPSGSAGMPTDANGQSELVFTPQQEESEGEGDEMSETASVEAVVSKLDVASKVWQQPLPRGAGVLLGKSANTSHAVALTIEWHEEEEEDYSIKIEWADVYDGVEDEFEFIGKLDKIVTGPECIGGEGVTCLTGKGVVNGDRGGWVGCNPGLAGQLFAGPATATFNGVIVGDTITISAFADFNTALSGVSSAPIEVPLDGPGGSYGPTEPVGDLCPHYSYGTVVLNKIDATLP
jgi:hypothetical protein